MTAALVAGLLKLLCGAQARWLGTAPSGDVRIYFANHTSNLDAVVLWATLPPDLRAKTRPVAAKDYWTKGRVRPFLAEKVFHALLIERHKVTVRENPLEGMLAALDEGFSLILFPEGSRFPGPSQGHLKAGFFIWQKDVRMLGLCRCTSRISTDCFPKARCCLFH